MCGGRPASPARRSENKIFLTYYTNTSFFAPHLNSCRYSQRGAAQGLREQDLSHLLHQHWFTPPSPCLWDLAAGITSEALLKSPENKIFPTYYTNTVGDLLTVKDKLSYCVIS